MNMSSNRMKKVWAGHQETKAISNDLSTRASSLPRINTVTYDNIRKHVEEKMYYSRDTDGSNSSDSFLQARCESEAAIAGGGGGSAVLVTPSNTNVEHRQKSVFFQEVKLPLNESVVGCTPETGPTHSYGTGSSSILKSVIKSTSRRKSESGSGGAGANSGGTRPMTRRRRKCLMSQPPERVPVRGGRRKKKSPMVSARTPGTAASATTGNHNHDACTSESTPVNRTKCVSSSKSSSLSSSSSSLTVMKSKRKSFIPPRQYTRLNKPTPSLNQSSEIVTAITPSPLKSDVSESRTAFRFDEEEKDYGTSSRIGETDPKQPAMVETDKSSGMKVAISLEGGSQGRSLHGMNEALRVDMDNETSNNIPSYNYRRPTISSSAKIKEGIAPNREKIVPCANHDEGTHMLEAAEIQNSIVDWVTDDVNASKKEVDFTQIDQDAAIHNADCNNAIEDSPADASNQESSHPDVNVHALSLKNDFDKEALIEESTIVETLLDKCLDQHVEEEQSFDLIDSFDVRNTDVSEDGNDIVCTGPICVGSDFAGMCLQSEENSSKSEMDNSDDSVSRIQIPDKKGTKPDVPTSKDDTAIHPDPISMASLFVEALDVSLQCGVNASTFTSDTNETDDSITGQFRVPSPREDEDKPGGMLIDREECYDPVAKILMSDDAVEVQYLAAAKKSYQYRNSFCFSGECSAFSERY